MLKLIEFLYVEIIFVPLSIENMYEFIILISSYKIISIKKNQKGIL